MATNGIGASVRRKEDHRFITGAGHYTDDIDRPGQAYAYFVRSPHAHARIKGVDKSRAEAAPGVVAVLDGDDVKAAGWGTLICGWMVKSRDGSDMKAWAVATCVLSLGGAVGVAVMLANSGSSTAENLAATLAMAERPVAAATARTAAAAGPSAAPNGRD